MKNRIEIEKKVLKIVELLVSSRKLAFDSYKMLVVDSSAKHNLIFSNKFLTRIRESLWKLAIIELSKVVGSRNEDHQLEKVLNILLNNFKNSDWRLEINVSELKKMLQKMKSDDVNQRIEKLLIIRNQHYAHNDAKPISHIYDIKFYFEDFEYLLEMAESFMEIIMQSLFEKDFLFKKYIGEDADEFFNEIIDERTKLAVFKMKNYRNKDV